MAESMMCGNARHQDEETGPAPAVWRVEWPDGGFDPTMACHDCLGMCIDISGGDQLPVLLTPLARWRSLRSPKGAGNGD